jgi:alkylation response protein AidB-like acyl-CoA dehydrogenase
MPRAGFIRALFIQLRSFKIDRSINHFIPATGTVNFCPESDDIPGGGHDQSTVDRHKIRQEMRALKNRLVQSRQAQSGEFDGPSMQLVLWNESTAWDSWYDYHRPGSVFGTVFLAIPALVAASSGQVRDELLAELVKGRRTAAFVVADRAGVPTEVSVTADGDALTGTVERVVDAGAADDLLVAARSAEGVALYAVDDAGPGVERSPLVTLDLTRPQATVRLSGAPGRLVAGPGEAERVIEHALQVGSALLAAEQVGAGQHLLDLSVDYAKSRLQFGRPIGSFQAVKHRLADLLVDLEHARSTAYHAVWALADGSDDPALAVALRRRLPIVIAGGPSTAGADCVTIDNEAAAASAARHLIELGHRELGVVTWRLHPDGYEGLVDQARLASARYEVFRLRLLGYQGAAAAAGAGTPCGRVASSAQPRARAAGVPSLATGAAAVARAQRGSTHTD